MIIQYIQLLSDYSGSHFAYLLARASNFSIQYCTFNMCSKILLLKIFYH